MLKVNEFYKLLLDNEIDFFTGVPDSLLKNFISYVSCNTSEEKHITAANEGNAMGIAAGYYLATRKIPLVYMQNSGLGNSVNPLVSLVDKEVYSIPMLLLIGYRGEPSVPDEVQHIKQGRITKDLLNTLEIPFKMLPNSLEEVKNILDEACDYMKKNSSTYALIVSQGSFESYEPANKNDSKYKLTREEAIKLIIDNISLDDVVISTTGKTSRELFEYRETLKQGHARDFLTVGSMGHANQIALGIAISNKKKNVYCIDGDGSLIMHMGSLGVIGSCAPKNFKHIVINNGAHESVGGQRTCGFNINISEIARLSGYKNVFKAETNDEVVKGIKLLKSNDGPSLIEIRVGIGSRSNLGRPTTSPVDNKKQFMEFLK